MKIFCILSVLIVNILFTNCTIGHVKGKIKDEVERLGNIRTEGESTPAEKKQLNGWPYNQKEMWRNHFLNATALAVNKSGDIFAAHHGAYPGMLRSTDNGKNWQSVFDNFPKDSIRVITDIAINARGNIFVATATHGVFRSNDNGDNWSHLDTIPTGYPYLFAHNDSIFILAASYRGRTFRSTDDGESWLDISNELENAGQYFYGDALGVLCYLDKSIRFKTATNVDFSRDSYVRTALNSSGHIFIGSTSHLLRSTDHGENWTDIASNIREYENETLFLSALTIDPRDNIYIWLGYNRSFGLFRSGDNGETWTKLFPRDTK